jgi:DNA-binding XRE family transcriptional regulator
VDQPPAGAEALSAGSDSDCTTRLVIRRCPSSLPQGKMTIKAAQLKAARQLLDWSQDDVANASGVSTEAVVYFEQGKRAPSARDLADIRVTLEAAGVEFTNGGEPGVKLRKAK